MKGALAYYDEEIAKVEGDQKWELQMLKLQFMAANGQPKDVVAEVAKIDSEDLADEQKAMLYKTAVSAATQAGDTKKVEEYSKKLQELPAELWGLGG